MQKIAGTLKTGCFDTNQVQVHIDPPASAKAATVPQRSDTLFPDEPRHVEIDDYTVDLVFVADHPGGGRSKASVAVPSAIAARRDTIEEARAKASETCRRTGAGGEMWVSIFTAW